MDERKVEAVARAIARQVTEEEPHLAMPADDYVEATWRSKIRYARAALEAADRFDAEHGVGWAGGDDPDPGDVTDAERVSYDPTAGPRCEHGTPITVVCSQCANFMRTEQPDAAQEWREAVGLLAGLVYTLARDGKLYTMHSEGPIRTHISEPEVCMRLVEEGLNAIVRRAVEEMRGDLQEYVKAVERDMRVNIIELVKRELFTDEGER